MSGPDGKTRSVNAYDSNGKRLWVLPSRKPTGLGSVMRFDPTGEVFFLDDSLYDGDRRGMLLKVPSKALLAVLDRSPLCIGRGADGSWGLR